MNRTSPIVLAKSAAPLPPEAKRRPPAAAHWGWWRNGGAALSVLLHVAVLAGLSLPVHGGPAPEKETTIPVEVVPRVPETKPEEKAEEKKKPDEKKLVLPDAKKIPEPAKLEPPAQKTTPEPVKPEPPKAETSPQQPAAKTAPPPPPAPPPKATPPAPAATPPTRSPEPAPPEPAAPPPSFMPEAKLPATPPPAPETPQAQPGLKVDAEDDGPPPVIKNGLGYWVLEPVTVNLGHRCGLARITGVLELKERIAEGRYRGTMRTRITWAACPAEGVLRQVELRIKGGEVEMVGTGGFIDRGVIGTKTMLLEDAFGRSVWKKR